ELPSLLPLPPPRPALSPYTTLFRSTPLVPGDEDYAISLVVPMNAEGLRLYPRRPYATTATSVFDYPLSSRFDEVDTTVVFNDVRSEEHTSELQSLRQIVCRLLLD